jgi:hypothetical protein
LVEQWFCKPKVAGSIPALGTTSGYRIMVITSAFQADDLGSIPSSRSKEKIMDFLTVWNELGYLDGVMFSLWLGIMYYYKSWVDYNFRDKK